MSWLIGGSSILFVVASLWSALNRREKSPLPVRVAPSTSRQGYVAHHIRR